MHSMSAIWFLLTVIFSLTASAQSGLNRNLIAWFSLNNSAEDVSSNKLHGIISGLVPAVDKDGIENQCYLFRGIPQDYIQVPYNKLFDFTDSFSISIWVYPQIVKTNNSQFTLISKLTEVRDRWEVEGYEMYIKDEKFVFATSALKSPSLYTEFKSTSYLFPDVWYHFVVSYHKSALRIYVNGKLDSYYPRIEGISNSTADLFIGKKNQNLSSGFKGKIDEIRLYNRALTTEEIMVLQDFKQTGLLNKTTEFAMEVTEVKGKVLNRTNLKPVGEAEIEFRNKDVVVKAVTDTSGNYSVILGKGRKYLCMIRLNSLIAFSEELEIDAEGSYNFKDFLITQVEIGKDVIIRNILFYQGKADFMPGSLDELDQLAMLMINNPGMEIELSGHTDNQGDARLNQRLSEKRVEAVEKYLISKGISQNRILGKGYGSSKPLASNEEELTRMLNRRVEYKVIKF